MKKYLRFAENYILLLASVTLGLFLLFFAPKEGGISESENRALQAFPELSASAVASGAYMEEFESFLSDSFPAREEMITISNGMMGLFGEADAQEEAKRIYEEEQGLVGDDAAAPGTEEASAVLQTESTAEETKKESTVSGEVREASLWLSRSDGARKIIEKYKPDTILYVASVLNLYRDALGPDGRLFFINSPASDVANDVLDSKRWNEWHYDLDEAMQPLLTSGVKIYSVPKILEPWREEGAMFSTSDLHWYVKTAWRVSNAFIRDLGYSPTDFYDYPYYLRDTVRNGPYTPDQLKSMTIDRENLMVPATISPVTPSIVTHLTEKKPTELYNFQHHGYTMYLSGSKGPYRLFETGFHTGRNALLISDSYGFAMAYYLFPFYDSVLQTDLRNANYRTDMVGASIREYIEEYGIDDIYIVTCQWTSLNGPVFEWRLEHFLDSARES